MTSLAPQTLQTFCGRHGVASPFEMHRLRSGRNSEVFHLHNDSGQWLLKHYHRHPQDTRDRLGTEFGFLTFLTESGISSVPRPLGADTGVGCGLYTFLSGTRPESVASRHIDQAAAFIHGINLHGQSAQALPLAADACLCWRDHVMLVETRINQLLTIIPALEPEFEAQAFISQQLQPYWTALKSTVLHAAQANDPDHVLAPELRILSPSDFGFHNTLEDDKQLFFVDFEYAGWDDPAKLICDFMCQPELPVSTDQGLQFQEALLPMLPGADQVRQRVAHLLPVHRLKWCCILLNEFKLADRQRRSHAGVAQEGLLARQLDKAQHYFTNHVAQAH